MTSMIVNMWTCHWARRRLQAYLDADPSRRLTAGEVHRLEQHLAACERCTALEQEYRGLARALAAWSVGHAPDPAAVARLRLVAQRVAAEDAP